MQNPDSQGPGDRGTENDTQVLSGAGVLQTHQSHTPQNEDAATNDRYKRVKKYLGKLAEAGPDRHVELILALMIGLFAGGQWITSCHNNDSTTRQTNQLIVAAQISGEAARQNAHAASDFAQSARSINNEMDTAVSKLNRQAGETAFIAESAKNSANTAAANLAEIERTERASISVREVSVEVLEPVINNQPAFSFFINLENSGSTATKHLTINPVCGGKPIAFSMAIKLQSIPAVIGPRSNFRQFTCEAIGEYALGSRFLVFGKINYGDVFGQEHITEYCWELVGLPSREHPTMQPCTYKEDAIHNCQDEDCPIE
jgi:hypothetical protein